MSEDRRATITEVLLRLSNPSSDPKDLFGQLFDLLYDDLRAVASGLMRRERPGHSLRPTALVHEAYLRLVDSSRISLKERAHFLGIATAVMRRVLVDHARRRDAAKRGGGWQRVTFAEAEAVGNSPELRVLDLDDVLARLEMKDGRMAQVAELKIFGELTLDEIAEVVGVSRRTVAEDWSVGKRWLGRELARLERER